MNIVGIDPGKTGGLVCLREDGSVRHFICDIASGMTVVKFFEDLNFDTCFVCIEKSQPMPKQGVTSTFTYGQGFGEILGVVQAFKMPFELIPPRIWTKEMFAGVSTHFEGKQRAYVAAERLFPLMEFRKTAKCKKAHLGLVDALLIAEYGRRKHWLKNLNS